MLKDNEDARDSLQQKIRSLCDAHEALKCQYEATNDNLRSQLTDRDATIQNMHRQAEATRKAHL
jgi:hypothetical protein